MGSHSRPRPGESGSDETRDVPSLPTRTVLYPPAASSPEAASNAFGLLTSLSGRVVSSWLIKAAALAVAFADAPPAVVWAGMVGWTLVRALQVLGPSPARAQPSDARAQELQLRATAYARAAGIADHAEVSLDGPEKAQLMTVTFRRRRTLAITVPSNSPVLDFPIPAQDAELRRRIALLGKPWRTWTVLWLTRILPMGVLLAYLLPLPVWAQALSAGPIAAAVLLCGMAVTVRAPLTREARGRQCCSRCGSKRIGTVVVATEPGADRRDPYVRCWACGTHYETVDGVLVEFLPAP